MASKKQKEEIYNHSDLIVPDIKFETPTEIEIRITDQRVSLSVGPRDWEWNRKTGELGDTGTFLG